MRAREDAPRLRPLSSASSLQPEPQLCPCPLPVPEKVECSGEAGEGRAPWQSRRERGRSTGRGPAVRAGEGQFSPLVSVSPLSPGSPWLPSVTVPVVPSCGRTSCLRKSLPPSAEAGSGARGPRGGPRERGGESLADVAPSAASGSVPGSPGACALAGACVLDSQVQGTLTPGIPRAQGHG